MTTDSWAFVTTVTVPMLLLLVRAIYMLCKTSIELKRFFKQGK